MEDHGPYTLRDFVVVGTMFAAIAYFAVISAAMTQYFYESPTALWGGIMAADIVFAAITIFVKR